MISMKKVLLIEDNDNIRLNTAEILELSNYDVIMAENGVIGVAMAIEHKPDIILCDIMMPMLDGYGVLHAVQKHEAIKNTPFIFLTARTERSDIRKAMEMGADDYITKPFTGTELLNAVDSRLRKIEVLKHDLAPALESLHHLVKDSLGKDILNALTEDRNINRYKKKQMVYTEGNHPNKLFFVLKGKVKAYKTNEDGKELVTDLYCKGDFLGYVALLEDEIYKDSTEALEETELALIPRQDFDELLHNNPEVMQKFIKLLAKNISEKESHLLGIAYNSLRKKVADALLMLQEKYRESKLDSYVIDISRESLATIAGTAKESLIRTLSDFKSERLIDINRDGSVVIINQQKLERLLN